MTINTQPIEKRQDTDGSFLDVHSIFDTIQGEGPYCGMPAVFVRLAGCNLQCPGCDTIYTTGRHMLPIADIAAQVEALRKPPHLVVITGGEPFRQNIAPFVLRLIRSGYNVQVETNGTLPPPANLPITTAVVCSPKTGKVNDKLKPFIDAYKYVISADSVNEEDGLPILALGHSASPQIARPHEDFPGFVYLQPMDAQDPDVNRRNLQTAVASCQKHGYILQIQIHKLIGLP